MRANKNQVQHNAQVFLYVTHRRTIEIDYPAIYLCYLFQFNIVTTIYLFTALKIEIFFLRNRYFRKACISYIGMMLTYLTCWCKNSCLYLFFKFSSLVYSPNLNGLMISNHSEIEKQVVILNGLYYMTLFVNGVRSLSMQKLHYQAKIAGFLSTCWYNIMKSNIWNRIGSRSHFFEKSSYSL